MFLRNVYSETLLLTIQNKTFQHRTFHPPNKTVNNKNSRKCKKQGIKNSFTISKPNAAILPTKIQMRRMTMNKLSSIDGLSK